MNSTATIKLLFLIVLFIFIERKEAARSCYKCESTPDEFDGACVRGNRSYVRPCSSAHRFCSVSVVRPVGSFNPKNFTVIRQCAQDYQPHRCETSGNLRTCTKTCTSHACNHDIPLSPPSDSITTTTPPPSVVSTIPSRAPQAARFCLNCTSTPEEFDEACVGLNVSYVRSCPGKFCSIKLVRPVGSVNPKSFTVIRQCAQDYQPHRCETSGNLRTCTKTCTSVICNYDLCLSPPSDSITTTTTSPSVVSTTPSRAPRPTSDVRRNSCYKCVSVNGNNSNCENFENASSIETQVCPTEKPYCSLEINSFRGIVGRMPTRTIKRTCSMILDSSRINCFAAHVLIGRCSYSCLGDFCNNSTASGLYLK